MSVSNKRRVEACLQSYSRERYPTSELRCDSVKVMDATFVLVYRRVELQNGVERRFVSCVRAVEKRRFWRQIFGEEVVFCEATVEGKDAADRKHRQQVTVPAVFAFPEDPSMEIAKQIVMQNRTLFRHFAPVLTGGLAVRLRNERPLFKVKSDKDTKTHLSKQPSTPPRQPRHQAHLAAPTARHRPDRLEEEMSKLALLPHGSTTAEKHTSKRSGCRFLIEANPNERIRDLKHHIHALQGYIPEMQHLVFNGRTLTDNDRLIDHDIAENCTLLLWVKRKDGTMRQYAKREIALSLAENATVGDLQNALEVETDIIPRMQKLVHKGRVLQSQDRLKNGAKIMLLSTDGTQTKGQALSAQSNRERLTKARLRAQEERRKALETAQRTPEGSVEMWKKLKMIVCRELGLVEFPLHALQVGAAANTADFSHNTLTAIPNEIHQLFQLRSLDMRHNRLSSITLGVFELKQLRKLHLDQNGLRALPMELGLLVFLEELTVSQNELTAIADCFSSLTALKLLDLSYNRLHALPPTLSDCSNLRTLEISANQILEFPESFCSLVQIHIIRASSNRMREVRPSLLRECRSLVMLDLRSNPITLDALRETEGFQEYDARRRSQYDKKIDRDACIPGSLSFEEGADTDNK